MARGNEPCVRVHFDDSTFEYHYDPDGLTLQVGDKVITPGPEEPGRYGYQRYSGMQIATVIGFGRTNYTGPMKALIGKVTLAGPSPSAVYKTDTASPREKYMQAEISQLRALISAMNLRIDDLERRTFSRRYVSHRDQGF